MKLDYGKVRVWAHRVKNNISYLQALMIFYLFLESANWHWWYWLVIIFMALWSYYDNSKGLNQELDYFMVKNKKMMKIIGQIDDLHKELRK